MCIIRELQHGVSVLLSNDPSRELIVIDRNLCSYLICLLSWSKTVPGEMANTKHLVIKSLFALCQIGSPRLQRLSLSLLSRVLPSSIPSEVVSDLNRRHSVISALIRRVGLAFPQIGGSDSSEFQASFETLFMTSSELSSNFDALVPGYMQWQGVHSGRVNFALSVDLMSLVRHLLVSEHWKRDVVSSLMKELRERKSEYGALATCLAILGGYSCVRSGGQIRNAGVNGTVLSYRRGADKALVTFGQSVDSPSVSFDSNELVSFSEDDASRRERAHALDSCGDETFVSELVESCIAVLRSDSTENELKMLAFDALRTWCSSMVFEREARTLVISLKYHSITHCHHRMIRNTQPALRARTQVR